MSVRKSVPMWKEAISAAIDTNKDDLVELSDGIWRKPELNFEEFNAHELLTTFLEKKDFSVERSCTGIKTVFTPLVLADLTCV